MSFVFLLNAFYLAENTSDVLRSEQFKKEYEVIIDDIKIESCKSLYYPGFLLQRLGYAIALIFLYDHPIIQTFVICLIFQLVFLNGIIDDDVFDNNETI